MHQDMKMQAAKKAFQLLKERMHAPFKLGIGSGSTSEIFLEILIQHQKELPPFKCVASSKKIYEMSSTKLPYMPDIAFEELDVYIDGADEVSLDHGYRLIKGGGACLTREKILYTSSKLRMVMVDRSKLSHGPIGSFFKRIPIEILPFASRATIHKIGLKGTFRAPTHLFTDQGGIIYDAEAPLLGSHSTSDACDTIRKIPGVIEVGVFPPPHLLIIGDPSDAEVIHV
ncbi:MAG: ribose 5-phosphate isomerase A [Chlamydiia bacterium]